MKYSGIFQSRLGCRDADETFLYLINNTKETIRSWDFYVNWSKINNSINNIEVPLNILNALIGKTDIKSEFIKLAIQYPEVISVIPILIATRENNIKILDPKQDNIFNYKSYNFNNKKYTNEEIAEIADFCDKIGILSMFKNRRIKSAVDYVTGVEVGLDTNARKNRSGTAMELITELFINKICQNHGYSYIAQATAIKIKQQFNYDVATDKSERSFDFAINTGDKLYLVETNYYSGGGTKLKSVAGEFSTLFSFIKHATPQHGFIWITDGVGWNTAKNPLREAFNSTDYILNLDMIEKGVLEDIITGGL